jgi:hypothetical protein
MRGDEESGGDRKRGGGKRRREERRGSGSERERGREGESTYRIRKPWRDLDPKLLSRLTSGWHTDRDFLNGPQPTRHGHHHYSPTSDPLRYLDRHLGRKHMRDDVKFIHLPSCQHQWFLRGQ